jgi:CBS domain-containing protein
MTQRKATPLARDYMQRHVHTVTPGMTLEEVVAFLLAHQVSSAPVVEEQDGHRVLVGFVSEHDCLDHLSNELFYGMPVPPQTAATIMRKHPVAVAPETELFTLASVFVHHGMRHLPVVEAGNLVGVISRRDILEAMERYYRDFLRSEEQQRHPPSLRDILAQQVVVTPTPRDRRG